MIAAEIQYDRSQEIILGWKRCLMAQRTIGDVLGKIQAYEVESLEVKKAIKFFEEQGLFVSIEKNSRLSRAFGPGLRYTITMTVKNKTSPLA